MENTAKNFALQLGSLISLYISIGALITLLFGIISIAYPDVAESVGEYDNNATSMRFAIALLIVFFPAYVVLTRIVNVIRRSEQGTYLTLTKWLIYLSLLIGGASLLGDLVAVVNSFLNGELTTRFLLKALSFLVVVGVAFVYYLLDARGFWQANETKSKQYGAAASVIVVLSLIVAIINMQTPGEVRETRIDARQINDLMFMQSQILNFNSIQGALPGTLDLAFAGMEVPTAPEGRAAYEYRVVAANTFELCADFANETPRSAQTSYTPTYTGEMLIKNPDNWNHGSGRTCFTRVLTYPIGQ